MPPCSRSGASAGRKTSCPGRLGRGSRDFGDRPAVDRAGVTVEQSELEESLHQYREAPRRENVGRDEATARTDVGEDRRPCADGVEVVDLERDTGFRGDREEVQHGIGRATGAENDAIAFSKRRAW